MANKNQQGFTLIETIIYIALLVLIMSAVMIATYNMIASTDKSQYQSLIHNDGQFIIAKFHSVLNGANSVDISGTTLTAHYPAGANRVISLSGNKIQVDGTTLNGDISPIIALSFLPASGSATRPAEVQMQFQIKNPYYDETFTTKKLMR